MYACRQVRLGETVFLQVSAFSAMPLSYTWYHNGKLLPGVTASETVIKHLCEGDQGSYRCVVSTPAGTVSTPDMRVKIRLSKVSLM